MNDVSTKSATDMVTMTKQEALDCIDKINHGVKELRQLLFDLHERKGWKVLGYGSWRDCVNERFTQSQSYLYRQVGAAKVEQAISPKGEIGVYSESVLRPISALSDKESMQEAWSLSMDKAADEKKDLPTAKITKAVVLEMSGQKPQIKPSSQIVTSYSKKIIKKFSDPEQLEMLVTLLENKLTELKKS